MEIRTDKEFKAIIMQMINELRRRMNEHGKKYRTLSTEQTEVRQNLELFHIIQMMNILIMMIIKD